MNIGLIRSEECFKPNWHFPPILTGVKGKRLRWKKEDAEKIKEDFQDYIYHEIHETGTKGPNPGEK